MLTDAAAIESVYEGPAGLLTADMCGKLFIEMSTVRPATEIALADKGPRSRAQPLSSVRWGAASHRRDRVSSSGFLARSRRMPLVRARYSISSAGASSIAVLSARVRL